jgi:PKD repeat protein
MLRHKTFGLALALVVATALTLSGVFVASAAPPANDNFISASGIDLNALPFSDSVDITEATTESGEPQACYYSQQTFWYKLTAATDTWLKADTSGSNFSSNNLNVYLDTGSGISGLSFLGCSSFGNPITFRAQAGATYYLQAEALCCGISGNLRVNVQQIPPPVPVANFGFYPGDPSIFDTLQFYDQSYDPGQVGIGSQAWNFGDGATATGCCPTHRYASDGDYTVQLTVTTFDNRTASTTRTVHVETHDVAITKFSAPQSASAGQTRQISVGINSRRYPETVQVQLFKSVPGGFQFVGVLEQSVPVRPSNRTTDFNFNYTFTSADASVGKVTFKAVATITGRRDALPADDEAIATPTKVNR